ncbi:MAG: hypothetical protein ACE1ZA_05240 [Pseudomonadales bacterium]
MHAAPFIPEDFAVPEVWECQLYRLRMLAVDDAELDYAAVMESQVRLRAASPNGWPREGFTLEENRLDLHRHEREFLAREAFAYTVVRPDETQVLGCVYLNPPQTLHTGVDVYLWTRDTEHRAGLTARLYAQVKDWLNDDWPFEAVNFVRTEYYLSTR